MDNVVTLSSVEPTDIELNVEIDGIATEEVDVFFKLCLNEKHNLEYACNKIEDVDEMRKVWGCSIPPLHIKPGTYPYKIAVICNGHYFCPSVGAANVIENYEVSIANVQNPYIATTPISDPRRPLEPDEDRAFDSVVKRIMSAEKLVIDDKLEDTYENDDEDADTKIKEENKDNDLINSPKRSKDKEALLKSILANYKSKTTSPKESAFFEEVERLKTNR
jgi:hypothetical protein